MNFPLQNEFLPPTTLLAHFVDDCSVVSGSQQANAMLRLDSMRSVAYHVLPLCRNNHLPINFTFSVATNL